MATAPGQGLCPEKNETVFPDPLHTAATKGDTALGSWVPEGLAPPVPLRSTPHFLPSRSFSMAPTGGSQNC